MCYAVERSRNQSLLSGRTRVDDAALMTVFPPARLARSACAFQHLRFGFVTLGGILWTF